MAVEPAIVVIIPALNEAEALPHVLEQMPIPLTQVVVVDNGSTDETALCAARAGARVVWEPRRGYGRACLAGVRHAGAANILVFLDADCSEDPTEMPRLVEPLLAGRADFVLGERRGRGRPWHASAGTRLCVCLINRLCKTDYGDLGPFRAIRRDVFDRLGMRDETWGWTIEMQVKAARAGLRTLEIPVTSRERIGRSKISGTFTGSLRAGAKMLYIIFRLWQTAEAPRVPWRRSL